MKEDLNLKKQIQELVNQCVDLDVPRKWEERDLFNVIKIFNCVFMDMAFLAHKGSQEPMSRVGETLGTMFRTYIKIGTKVDPTDWDKKFGKLL